MDIYIIIPAGGSGSRFGALKQFVPLAGEPLIHYTVRRLLGACAEIAGPDSVRKIVIAAPRAEIERMRSCLSDFGERLIVVEGGETRAQSVQRAYAHLGLPHTAPKDASASSVLLVHDGCRPFVSSELLSGLFTALERSDFAMPALRVTDTVKDIRSLENIPREQLITVQTPQTMRLTVAQTLYGGDAQSDALHRVTDDSSLAQHYGYSISAVPGDRINMKITEPEDLAIASALHHSFKADRSDRDD